jgi:hypothetical protein
LPQNGLLSIDRFLQLEFLDRRLLVLFRLLLAPLLCCLLLVLLGRRPLPSLLILVVSNLLLSVHNPDRLSDKFIQSGRNTLLENFNSIDVFQIKLRRQRFKPLIICHKLLGIEIVNKLLTHGKFIELGLHKHKERFTNDIQLCLQPTRIYDVVAFRQRIFFLFLNHLQ